MNSGIKTVAPCGGRSKRSRRASWPFNGELHQHFASCFHLVSRSGDEGAGHVRVWGEAATETRPGFSEPFCATHKMDCSGLRLAREHQSPSLRELQLAEPRYRMDHAASALHVE